MKIHDYGSYAAYVKTQEASNIRKLNSLWVSDQEIDLISNYIKDRIATPKLGICHGVRKGYEVSRFRKNLGIDVIGTDISKTANDFENVIQWDFHKVKQEWLNSVDFVYSNSLDHSYDPHTCLKAWLSCLAEGGLCFIHWGVGHGKITTETGDCFAASRDEYREMLSQHAHIRDEIRINNEDRKRDYSVIFVLTKGDQ
jgi:hypothetical protein